MRRTCKDLTLFVCAAAMFAGGVLHAQSIAITPGYTSVGVGGTVQYSAAVTGLMNTTVKWSVSGVVGGNSTNGTITAGGLYTAPAAIPANGVTISALGSDNKTMGIVYVNVAPVGPPITGVSPNPIPVGTVMLTFQGSGFKTGAVVWEGGVQLSAMSVTPTAITASVYHARGTTSASFFAMNPGTLPGPTIAIPVSGTTSTGGGTPGGGTGGGGGSGGGGAQPPVVAPSAALVVLGATQQFSAPGATAWAATAGAIGSTGLYTAPAAMPVTSSAVTITASNAGGQSTAAVTLVSNTPPAIQSLGVASLPIGVFSISVGGAGFIKQSAVQLNGAPLIATYVSASSLTVSGFAGAAGPGTLTVSNGPVVSPAFPVQIGVPNPQVSAAAARRFLEQGAFGPTPNDAAHVQTVGFPRWLSEQFAMPKISNYNGLGSQGGLPPMFLANAVTNADQLRQRVAFALSQIFVVSINKLIWNGDAIPYQEMLMTDAFTNYRQILGDVTLSPAMGDYLDMANNAKANPRAGSVANENYAREALQLFSIGDKLLNPDGSVQFDSNNLPAATYSQFTITEFARAFTGWTYAPPPGVGVSWPAYITENGPMVPYSSMHDMGSKTLLNGYVSPANVTPQQDLANTLDNIFNHPNVGPFIGKQLIQHLVKSNPSSAYVKRVADAFADNGHGVRGDMQAVITAVLLDPEARANDEGGMDQATDGHLQEPALFIAGFVRAFGGQMANGNYYSMDLATMGQDIYNSPSVFNYYSPLYQVPGTALLGGEFQIDTANNAIYRANVVTNLFSAYSNPVQTYGPTSADLTPYLALAANPATLVGALDLTLTHGTMPSAMKQIIVNAITADSLGALHQVQTGIYLILSSDYYNVWH